jgi:CheY-like chemotaxis protein
VKILFVEDEPELHRQVRDELEAHDIEILTAENAAEALALVDEGGFDLFLCDLRIPASPDAPIPHKQHGLSVYDRMRVSAPGVPTIIFTAYGEMQDLRDRLSEAPSENLYGDGTCALVVERKKDELKEVIEFICAQAQKLKALKAEIELSGHAARAAMSDLDARLISIHARAHGGVTAHMALLAGGRSGASVLRLETKTSYGTLTSRVVGKLNSLEEVEDELRRYSQHVPMLGAGCYTNHVETLRAGAQHRAALFYALAEGYDESLFDILGKDDSAAAAVVGELQNNLRPWQDHPHAMTTTVAGVRRLFVPDSKLGELPDWVDWRDAKLEALIVYVNEAPVHGDLHGGNVLVDAEGRPMLIDFGRVGTAMNAVDSVTLELSAVLHPDAKLSRGDWPAVTQAEHWNDLEAYLDGCPFAGFVSRCRDWTMAVRRGDREVDAVVFAYALRQLRYGVAGEELATAYSRGAAARLSS